MNKADSILPDSMLIFPHFAAFDISVKQYLEQIKLEMLLVYFIDQVDSRALPLIAKQFDVLGYKGWRLATTEQQQRDLLHRAIELHRYKGTLWAVKEALKSIGFEDIQVQEHVDGNWAKFALFLNNQDVALNADGFSEIIAMVEEYKNVRSYLTGLQVSLVNDDELDFDDDNEYADVVEEVLGEDIVYFTAAHFYDGTSLYNGLYDHSGDSDEIQIT